MILYFNNDWFKAALNSELLNKMWILDLHFQSYFRPVSILHRTISYISFLGQEFRIFNI